MEATPTCQERLGYPPTPSALNCVPGDSASTWRGLGREQDTVNLEQTFISCADLVGPRPWVSGN